MVIASSSAGANVTSSVASVVVLSPTLTDTGVTPISSTTGLNPDTRLSITFNQSIATGVSGQINIFDAANPSTPVDTIDLVAGTALDEFPAGGEHDLDPGAAGAEQDGRRPDELQLLPDHRLGQHGDDLSAQQRPDLRAQLFCHGRSGGFHPTGPACPFPGLSGSSALGPSSTKPAGPAAGSTALVVAADGSGDFSTVQAALDFIPAGNTTPTTITIKVGTYFEQVYFASKHAITFQGADRAGTVIVYPNNNTFNNVSGTYHRMVFQADHTNNVVVKNLTVQNSTPHNGSQAEALLLNGTLTSQAIVTGVNLVSFQDTLQINGQAYISDSHISG